MLKIFKLAQYNLDNFYNYYAEGGGAIRTNNLVGGEGINTLTFIDNIISVNNGNKTIDKSMSKATSKYDQTVTDGLAACQNGDDDDDCGDGAWGGAAYINDGWWAQQGDGTVTIKASGNIADWGAVGYATMVQQGSIIFGNNARGKWSQNSSQQKSWTFAGGGCSSSKISGFNCCEVDNKITCNN